MTQTAPRKLSNVEVKVHAVNTNNSHTLQLVEHWKNHLSQFIGKDIFKVDGTLKEKYKNPQPLSIEGKTELFHYSTQAYITNRRGYIDLQIKTCINGGSYDVQPHTAFCQYENRSTEIFRVDDEGKLQPSENSHEYLKKQYNVEELQAIAKEIEAAAEAYKKAADKMPYQFNDVFYIQRLTR